VKAENAEVRELLRKMEEQQKILLEQVDRLQRRLDGGTPANAANASQPLGPTDASAAPDAASNSTPAGTNPASTSGPPAAAAAQPPNGGERYQDGIIIWKTPDDAKVPFLLRFNNNTQIRYLNTLNSNETFTDHLGVVREVHRRNDITVNRSMFILGGYIWTERCDIASPSGLPPARPR
jgi:hypothetical protein